MATRLIHKRSSTSGDVPSTTSLVLGELAINTTDGYIYLKKDDSGEEILRLRGEPLNNIAVVDDQFTGDGSTLNFTLSRTPEDEQFVFVSINGVLQHTSAYSIAGKTLTFTAAPATGDAIEARIFSVRSSALELRDYETYVYTISSTTTSISGADDSGAILAFDGDKVEVYFNGVRLVYGNDFSVSGGTTINLNDAIEDGHVEVVSLSKASFVDHNVLAPFTHVVATAGVAELVDRFMADEYRTAKYLVTMTSGTDYHTTEVLVMHDGTDVYITEYGTMFTNTSLGTVSADLNSGYLRLLVTPANSSTQVKGQRLLVAV